MKPETVDALLDALQAFGEAYCPLADKVAAFEGVVERHFPELREEYLQELGKEKLRGRLSAFARTLGELRTKLLQDQ